MSDKNKKAQNCHMSQANNKLNIPYIIEVLKKDGILSDNVKSSDWLLQSKEIYDQIKEKLREPMLIPNQIKIIIKISSFKNLLSEDTQEASYLKDRFRRIYLLQNRDNRDKNRYSEQEIEFFDNIIDNRNLSLLEDIFVKTQIIENEIFRILEQNIHLKRTSLAERDNIDIKIEGLEYFKSILSDLRRYTNLDKIDTERLKIINENLNKIFLDKDFLMDIEFRYTSFLKYFLSRIDLLYEEVKKDSFIEIFIKKRKEKEKICKIFLIVSIILFSIVVLGNGILFYCNISSNKTLSEFFYIFLGRGIYVFFIETITISLAFYFLTQFKTYKKIVELYDSHILLIESDFFYKNDEQFKLFETNEEMFQNLFEMRRQNTQKIHNLPNKITDIINGENTNTKDDIIDGNLFLSKLTSLFDALIHRLLK